jgi:hypothetical protein
VHEHVLTAPAAADGELERLETSAQRRVKAAPRELRVFIATEPVADVKRTPLEEPGDKVRARFVGFSGRVQALIATIAATPIQAPNKIATVAAANVQLVAHLGITTCTPHPFVAWALG